MAGHSCRAQMLLHRALLVLHFLSKEEAAGNGKVPQPPGARSQQVEDRVQPRALLSVVRIVPKACVMKPRPHASSELFERQPEHVLLVEPIELLGIEDRPAAANAREPKDLGELDARKNLAVAATRRPAEQREKVDHGLRQVSLSRVLHHRGRTMPLTQALAIGAEN